MSTVKTTWSQSDIPQALSKYYFNRYSLFSRFDDGIQLDYEGWFSVTPEAVALHIAHRMVGSLRDALNGLGNSSQAVDAFSGVGNSITAEDAFCGKPTQAVHAKSRHTVVDAFCGVGGNSIQFALLGAHVIAVDLDPVRLECARVNAEVYGVLDKITFILGDFFLVAPTLLADSVFLSPPWGGPEYLALDEFDLETCMAFSGSLLYETARRISPNVCYFLPRNTGVLRLGQLSKEACELERVYLNDREKCICVYFGNLVHTPEVEDDGGWDL